MPSRRPSPSPGELIDRYRAVLPFQLTEHQERAIMEIDLDLAQTTPMQRLLQGDVGSGKTVVALYALLRAVESSRQGALMAPTETLAEQHFLTLEPICAQLGVRCVLLTGSVGSKKIRDEIANGVAQIAVGTHALIQRDVDFADLAVAVVDEQHRFGVEQRTALAENRSTHVLHMTATPIPRTLALTIYGDLSVSEIAKPPANRKPVITARVGAERSSDAYTRLRVHLDAGRQAYVVCPLIELSETRLARAAEAEADRLRRAELSGYRVGLLHGKLKTAERREVMRQFKEHELDVLVATTVIEVGVDIPERDDHDRAGGGPVRPRAAAPAARPGRTRGRPELLPPDLAPRRGAHRDGGAAPAGTRRNDRRIRARGGRPRPAARGPAARHPPVRLERSAVHEAAARPRPDRACARDRRRACAVRTAPGRTRPTECPAMRIIAGSHRGHRIAAPTGRDTRPTSDRVRENAFNLIGPVDDADVLDLFAGSGALGLEALSRGAATATFVESDRDACRTINANLDKLRLRGTVLCQDVTRALARRAPQLRPRPLRPTLRLRPCEARAASRRPA